MGEFPEPDWITVGVQVAVLSRYRSEDRSIRFTTIAKVLKRDVVLDLTDASGDAIRFRRTSRSTSTAGERYLYSSGTNAWDVSEQRLYRADAPEIQTAAANIRRRNITTRATSAAQQAATKLTAESAQQAIDALQLWLDSQDK